MKKSLYGGSSKVFGDGFDYWGFNAFGNAVWLDQYKAIAFLQSSGQNKTFLRVSDGNDQNIITPIQLFGTNFGRDIDGNLLFFQAGDPTKILNININQKITAPALNGVSLPSQATNVNDFWEKYRRWS